MAGSPVRTRWHFRSLLTGYLGTILFLAVVVLIGVGAGFGGIVLLEKIDDASDQPTAFFKGLRAMSDNLPRLPDGRIIRQGTLSTPWLYQVGALSSSLQAMGGSLHGYESDYVLGLVLRGPWGNSLNIEARDTALWVRLAGVPMNRCLRIASRAVKSPSLIDYITAAGDNPFTSLKLDPKWLCRQEVTLMTFINIDPRVEWSRLIEDLNHTAPQPVGTTLALARGKSSALQFKNEESRSANEVTLTEDRQKFDLSNVSFAACRLAMMAGPSAYGMSAFGAADGSELNGPQEAAKVDAICRNLGGNFHAERKLVGH
jgi:hypothetical protein